MVAASDKVRALGVTLTSDPCLDKHVASVCATCFHWLRQLKQLGSDVHLTPSQRLRWPTLLCDVTRELLQRRSRWGIQVQPPQTSSSDY